MDLDTILVYSDQGVSKACLNATLDFFSRNCTEFTIATIDAASLTAPHSDWEARSALLVMPGGRDIPYDRLLRGEGNRRIRQFVETLGRSYLGICAGAYYACSEVCFELDTPMEVGECRELGFFRGRTVGCSFLPGRRLFRYDSEDGASSARVRLRPRMDLFDVYYNGGCTFIGDGQAEVLADYTETATPLPAVVYCTVGKGRAVLSGVHFEISTQKVGPCTTSDEDQDLPGRESRELSTIILSKLNIKHS